jgi:hypothetical protein
MGENSPNLVTLAGHDPNGHWSRTKITHYVGTLHYIKLLSITRTYVKVVPECMYVRSFRCGRMWTKRSVRKKLQVSSYWKSMNLFKESLCLVIADTNLLNFNFCFKKLRKLEKMTFRGMMIVNNLAFVKWSLRIRGCKTSLDRRNNT